MIRPSMGSIIKAFLAEEIEQLLKLSPQPLPHRKPTRDLKRVPFFACKMGPSSLERTIHQAYTSHYFMKLSAVTFLILCLLAPRLRAQTIVPFAADVKSFQVVLQPSGIPVTLKFSSSGNTVFYFPPISIQNVQVSNAGGPLVAFSDAQGNLQIPSGPSAVMSVTLRDFLQDIELQNEILTNLATNSFVVQLTGPAPVVVPAGVQPRVARLVFSDPFANNTQHILGQSLFTGGDGTPTIQASFFLNSDALALLRTAPVAQNLSVAIDQTYLAQFRTNDLTLNLSAVQASLAQVLTTLDSIPGVGSPTYLLSTSLPAPSGGSVQKDSSFSSSVRNATELAVLVRQGSNVDPTLFDSMLSFVFNQANLAIAVSAQERSNAVATVLLADGLSITLALGHLNDVALDIKNDTTGQYASAFTAAATKSQATTVQGSVSANVIDIFGGSASASVAQNWTSSNYVNQQLSTFSQQLHDMAANVSGDITYLTGISFNSAGVVQNLNYTSVEENFGQFTINNATLEQTRSFLEYAQLLNQARQVEALIVPQVLVGVGEVVGGQWTKLNPTDWAVTQDLQVTFPKPFSSPPSVVCGFDVLNNNNLNPAGGFLFYAAAVNITNTGFTIRFQQHPDNIFYWISASWVATGQSAIAGAGGTLAGLANPGSNVALIPGAVRQTVRQTRFISNPSLSNGNVTFPFATIPGLNYGVQSSDNLVDWNSLGVITATDFTSLFTGAVAGGSQSFFRIVAP
jgi:hypothetical protein